MSTLASGKRLTRFPLPLLDVSLGIGKPDSALSFSSVDIEMGEKITPEAIEQKLKNHLETTFMNIEDVSDGCGAKFQAIIVSPKFDGKPLLERHRMVNTALEEELKIIHAFQMKTLTPDQWAKQNS